MKKLIKAKIEKTKQEIAELENDKNPQVQQMVIRAKERLLVLEAVLDALNGDNTGLRLL